MDVKQESRDCEKMVTRAMVLLMVLAMQFFSVCGLRTKIIFKITNGSD